MKVSNDLTFYDGILYIFCDGYCRVEYLNDEFDESKGISLEHILNVMVPEELRHDVIYVMHERGLEGTIYQCNNYEHGEWWEHGTTKGYA